MCAPDLIANLPASEERECLISIASDLGCAGFGSCPNALAAVIFALCICHTITITLLLPDSLKYSNNFCLLLSGSK